MIFFLKREEKKRKRKKKESWPELEGWKNNERRMKTKNHDLNGMLAWEKGRTNEGKK